MSSQNSGPLNMQLLMSTMETMMLEHFERINKQFDEHYERVSNIIETTRQEIRQINLDTCEKNKKKVIGADDGAEQNKTSDNHQVETSTSAPEEIQVTEIQQIGAKTETRAMEFSGRHGERKAPDEQNMEANVAERISSKPRKRRVRSLTAAGARRKKRKKKLNFSKNKRDVRRKTTHGKSQKEAFQAWLDQVRKQPREQTNKVRQRTTEMQRHVPWDPGGSNLRNTSSKGDSSKPVPSTCCYKDPCARLVNRSVSK
jgi:hypothetical protein